MNRLLTKTALTGALFLLLATASLPAQSTPTAPAVAPAAAVATPPVAPAVNYDPFTPAPVTTAPWWMPRHQEKVARVKQGNVDLLFIGDSITHQWEKADPVNPDHNYLPLWQEFYGDRNAVDLGFSGDETQNLLWRFANGELDNITPKAAVLMIGTNNTGRHLTLPAQRTLIGILAVVEDLHRRLPNTKILLLGIFPSKISPTKTGIDSSINEWLKTIYSTSSYVTFMDISDAFRKDGAIDCSLYGDKSGICLHPNVSGQRKWAEAIEPTLSQLLGDKNKLKK